MAKKAVWVGCRAICGDGGKIEPDITAALVTI
jgi:hypothetical protein